MKQYIKIVCFKTLISLKFFEETNQRVERDRVKYDVLTDFGKLMEIVGGEKDRTYT